MARKAELRVIRQLVHMTCEIFLRTERNIHVNCGDGWRAFFTAGRATSYAMQFDDAHINKGSTGLGATFNFSNDPGTALSDYSVGVDAELKPVRDAADAWDEGNFEIKFPEADHG